MSRRQDLQALWDTLSSGQVDERPSRIEVLCRKIEGYLQETATFVHFAEGRANAVFKILPHGLDLAHHQSPENEFADALVRVPKKIEGTDPHNYKRLQKFRETMIEPAVGVEYLVPQLLMKLSEAQVDDMNEKRTASGKAKDDSTIEPGDAMLIQDMTPRTGQLGLEFKPKWLAQSPIAPADATRCRTCAREAYRNSQKAAQGKSFTPPVCPLGLLHDDPAVVLETIAQMAPASWSRADHARLRVAFDTSRILHKLRDVQTSGDPGNTMFENPNDPDFGLAMTMRDCTCFVRMPEADGEGDVEIKLADVDEKNWVSKQEYWQESHNNLVNSGFYHGTERPRMETHCVLGM